MCFWGRMEKISWTDRVRNDEVLLRVKKERNIFQNIKRRKAKWIGHILRRNCLIRRFIEGEIEVARRRGKRSKQLLGDLKETRGYCKLKRWTVYYALRRTHFVRGYGLVVRQTTGIMSAIHVVFLTWRFMHQIVSEYQYLYTRIHGVTLTTS
jgi:hypothetical protein